MVKGRRRRIDLVLLGWRRGSWGLSGFGDEGRVTLYALPLVYLEGIRGVSNLLYPTHY